MPAFGNLALNNGAATPVSQTFEPVRITGSLAKFQDKIGGVPAAYPTLQVSLDEPKNSSSNYRGYVKISIPSLDPVSHAKIGEDIISMNLQLAAGSAVAVRKDLLAYAANFLNSATGQAVFADLSSIY